MADAVIMPKAGMAMEEGVIIQWYKQEGDAVQAGEALLEIETDKVSMEVEAERSGVLLAILHQAGATVPVTMPIGYIGKSGEAVPKVSDIPSHSNQGSKPAVQSAAEAELSAQSTGPAKEQAAIRGMPSSALSAGQEQQNVFAEGGTARRRAATPHAVSLAEEYGISLDSISPSRLDKIITAKDIQRVLPQATPLARRVAAQLDVPLRTVTGSRKGGEIAKRDVLAAKERAESIHVIPMSRMRQTVAKNMVNSHKNIPPVTLHGYAVVDALLALRKKLNTNSARDPVTINDMVIKAAVMALQKHGRINSWYDEQNQQIQQLRTINLGVAVAMDDGLLVPVIHNAETLDIFALHEAAQRLITAARGGSLHMNDMADATFTVTNLGMYGVVSFTPIINPPQVAILGIGSIEEHIMLQQDTSLAKRKTIGLSLTIDHRVLDGAVGALFLQTLRDIIEAPEQLQ